MSGFQSDGASRHGGQDSVTALYVSADLDLIDGRALTAASP